jgi:hypothetical protein
VVGSPALIAAGCANQTNDRWARPVGAANAVGRRPVLLHASLALASSHHPPRNAAYSIGTSSSLRRVEGIPDKPIRIQSSRERFRQDTKGMRAIAVRLVILFHTYHKPFSCGFVGVDVFFVISGFLITNLLLKEQKRAGRFSISGFYARRVRWILPASTLVVLITLFATYDRLGFIAENYVANDSKWTAIFAANIHFGLVRTAIQSRLF